MLSLVDDACRGFSLWDEYAPLIAANTAWNAEARAFTLFHEYAHLLTRTPSACLEGAFRRASRHDDPDERWCERFAAAVILPREDLRSFLLDHGVRRRQTVADLNLVRSVARHFNASLRATTLSLIEMGQATWSLYAALPPGGERRPHGGGGAGRTRIQIRQDQYGARTFDTFSHALQQEVLSRGDILDYLDVPPGMVGASGDRSASEHE
jgi:Zn-dependent peptidase ImmA (M78 family)